jgi:hypothetical protein
MNICYIIETVSEIKMLENGSVLFCVPFWRLNLQASFFLRTFAVAMKMQRRLRAAAQRRPSELASAFTLHRNCTVITKREAADRCRSSQNNLLTQKLN